MIEYSLVQSARAKHMRITIHPDERVVVTIPRRLSREAGKRFAESKKEWIDHAVKRLQKHKKPGLAIPKASATDYKDKKGAALALAQERLRHFNTIYKLTWNGVSIKNTSSRWGSCSKQANLNFNYRIIYLPEHLADYLVVHELCHLQEFNHSDRFWKLVEKTIPDYKTLRREIRVM